MISESTLKCLNWAFKLASFLQVTSFDWDDRTQSFILKTNRRNSEGNNADANCKEISNQRWNKAIRIHNVVYRFSAIVFVMSNVVVREDVSSFETILAMYFSTIWSLDLPTIILFLIWDSKLVNYLNSMLRLNSKLSKLIYFLNYSKICRLDEYLIRI